MTGHYRKLCPQCKRLRWIPRTLFGKPNTAGHCTPSCGRAARRGVPQTRTCEVCGVVRAVTSKELTCIRLMWRCTDEQACARRAIEQTTHADRAAMQAALDQSWDTLRAEGWFVHADTTR